MTVLHPDTGTSLGALQACADLLMGVTPEGVQASIEQVTSVDAVDVLGLPGWRAVTARLVGLDATLSFALSPESAAMLERVDNSDSDDSDSDSDSSTMMSVIGRLGARIGESLGVEISIGETEEISCQEVVGSCLNEQALCAALRTPEDLLAILVVTYDDGTDAAGAVGNLAVHEFEPLDTTAVASGARSLELLSEVEMGVTAELGRTRLLVKDILALTPGSVIELDRAAGSPIDVLVNGTLIARGEVVVIDEEFGIRISEIVGYETDPKVRRR